MENKVILSTIAAKEIGESYQWYEDRSVGLENRFVDLVDKTIQS